MSTTVTITPIGDYLYVCVSGVVETTSKIISYMADIRTAAKKDGIRKILLNYTEADFLLDYHDLMTTAEYAVERDFQLDGLRIAVLSKEDNLNKHIKFETLANNRSISYKVFSAETPALDWLRNP